jgi:hypothetical protein
MTIRARSFLLLILVVVCGCNGNKAPARSSTQTTDLSAKVLPQIQGRFVSQNGALRIKAGGGFEMQIDQDATQGSDSASCTMTYKGTMKVLNVRQKGNSKASEILHFDVTGAEASAATGAKPALCASLASQVLAQKSFESTDDERDATQLNFAVAFNQDQDQGGIVAKSASGPYLNSWIKKGASIDKTEDFLNQSTQYAELQADGTLSSSVFLTTNSTTGIVTYDNPNCGFKFNLNVSKVSLGNGHQTLIARDAEESASGSATAAAETTDCASIESALKASTGAGIGLLIYDTGTPSFRLDLH